MNMAYYHVAFDRAVDFAYDQLGLGAHYVETAQASLLPGGARLLSPGAEPGEHFTVSWQLLGFDSNGFTFRAPPARSDYRDLRTNGLHVSMETRRTAPFPEEAVARLDHVAKAHAASAEAQKGRIREFAPEGNGNWRDRNIIGHA